MVTVVTALDITLPASTIKSLLIEIFTSTICVRGMVEETSVSIK